MKNLFLAFAMMFTMHSFAQDKVDTTIENLVFKCEEVRYNRETNILELLGNVSLKTDIIEFINAERVVLNNESNELIISGLTEFTIDGKIQISQQSERKIVRYTIGEQIAFVE